MTYFSKADFVPNYSAHLEAAGQMIDQRYARFGMSDMSDRDVWCLSLATLVSPKNGIGYEAYITWVSGTDAYVQNLREWGCGLARAVARSQYKARDGKRRRTLVEGYRDEWGLAAVNDALCMVMTGDFPVSAKERREQFSIDDGTYSLIRDFVAASICTSIRQFKFALEWSWGYRSDKYLSSEFSDLRLKSGEVEGGDNLSSGEGDAFQRVRGVMSGSLITMPSDARSGLWKSTPNHGDPVSLYPEMGNDYPDWPYDYSRQELMKSEHSPDYIFASEIRDVDP